MNRQTILFDMDDTLIHCNKYFDIVLEQFADELQTWFAAAKLTKEEIKSKQLEIDTIGVNLHGFKADHFPASLVETYDYFSELLGRPRSEPEIRALLQLGKSVFDHQIEPYPAMAETLTELKADGHELYLYTGGEETIQRRKVETMELNRFFGDRVFIRQHKTVEAMERIVQEMSFDRSATWMVGNSIRTDIVPALHAGIHAIHVPAITEWQYNVIDITVEPKGNFLRVANLAQVPEAIRLLSS